VPITASPYGDRGLDFLGVKIAPVAPELITGTEFHGALAWREAVADKNFCPARHSHLVPSKEHA
jgi:hypothetical protein